MGGSIGKHLQPSECSDRQFEDHDVPGLRVYRAIVRPIESDEFPLRRESMNAKGGALHLLLFDTTPPRNLGLLRLGLCTLVASATYRHSY